jgi:Uma2 family endonuclease
MSSALRQTMTLTEFLAWEEQQDLRYEFDGVGPVAMNGGTITHSTIQGNLMLSLQSRLRKGPCRAHGSGLKIQVAERIRYPDAVVVCSRQPGPATIADQPVTVFEILSPATSRTDRIVKAREYGATESIQRYVILEQSSQAATVFSRLNGVWASVVLDGEVELPLPELGIVIPLAEFYQDVDFPPDEDG